MGVCAMARNGVWQLKRLSLRYCPFSGSSAGVRDFVSEMFEGFRMENAHLDTRAEERRGRHPFLEGEYGMCGNGGHDKRMWHEGIAPHPRMLHPL